MNHHLSLYLKTVLLAFFVTVLWSSSWLFIKWGLQDEQIPPLFFAGIRFSIASIILVGVLFFKKPYRKYVIHQNKQFWVKHALYGFVFVTITQGALHISLFYLPAITVTLILSFTFITALFFSIIFLNEKPSIIQLVLIVFVLVGLGLYFHDKIYLSIEIFGLIIAIIAMIGNAGSFIIGRALNKTKTTPALIVTGLSMTIGSTGLLVGAFLLEKIPHFSLVSIFYILYLSLISTALAFTLWNYVMQTLGGMEVTIINSTVVLQIVIFSFFFLGEQPTSLDWVGIFIVGLGVFLIQISQTQSNKVEFGHLI